MCLLPSFVMLSSPLIREKPFYSKPFFWHLLSRNPVKFTGSGRLVALVLKKIFAIFTRLLVHSPESCHSRCKMKWLNLFSYLWPDPWRLGVTSSCTLTHVFHQNIMFKTRSTLFEGSHDGCWRWKATLVGLKSGATLFARWPQHYDIFFYAATR